MGKRRRFEWGICPWSSTGLKLKQKLKLMETAGGEDIGRETRERKLLAVQTRCGAEALGVCWQLESDSSVNV